MQLRLVLVQSDIGVPSRLLINQDFLMGGIKTLQIMGIQRNGMQNSKKKIGLSLMCMGINVL